MAAEIFGDEHVNVFCAVAISECKANSDCCWCKKVWNAAIKHANEKFTTHNKKNAKLPADVVEGFNKLLAKYRSNMWSSEQHIMDQVASFIGM